MRGPTGKLIVSKSLVCFRHYIPAAVFLLLMPAFAGDVAGVPGQSEWRSPVDLVLLKNQQLCVTANETTNTLSLIDLQAGSVIDEVVCGTHPCHLQLCHGGNSVAVTEAWDGSVSVFAVRSNKLVLKGRVHTGFEPTGLTVSQDGNTAFAALAASGEVVQLDLAGMKVFRRISVGPWPQHLTLAADDKRLSVGCAGDSSVYVINAESGEVLYDEPLVNSINFGHMTPSADGKYAYVTYMVYRTNPITVGNLRRGWLLASRIGRVRTDGSEYREAISLDVPRRAVADPHGLIITPDEQTLVASASGTHELLVYRLPDLPFVGIGGPGDLIDRGLQYDENRFHRIELGGRPMGLEVTADSQYVYTANYLLNCVQKVDLKQRNVVQQISLSEPTEKTAARKGMEVFYDGTRSLDQWYSCHSCHQNGGSNMRPMDTWNDGTEKTLKTVLPLYNVTKTAPWTWHGWQQDLDQAMHKSITSTMLGEAPADEDRAHLISYLETLKPPPNPFRNQSGGLTAEALAGKQVFESAQANCVSCHSGPHLTDGQIHDVGLGSSKDYYEGYNTPSLNAVYRKARLLHTGRAKSLERVVTDLHSPEKVSGSKPLTQQQVSDLIAYLKSL